MPAAEELWPGSSMTAAGGGSHRQPGQQRAAEGSLRVCCSHQVEVWLNRVLASMRSTLRHLIPEAVVTYEEKPREQWVFDYPAQVGSWGGQGRAEGLRAAATGVGAMQEPGLLLPAARVPKTGQRQSGSVQAADCRAGEARCCTSVLSCCSPAPLKFWPRVGTGSNLQENLVGAARTKPVPGRGGESSFPLIAAFCRCDLLQVALTCTQIWWTTEVGIAFARLEEGYENAIKDYNKKQVCIPGTLSCSPPPALSRLRRLRWVGKYNTVF